MHEVLEAFGMSSLRDSADELAISTFLQDQLEETFGVIITGSQPAPTVILQRTQLAHRLHAFASAQADWRRAGWRIYQTEGELSSVTVECELGREPCVCGAASIG